MDPLIRTSHAGSLPRPPELIELNRRRRDGDGVTDEEFEDGLRRAVHDVVARQVELGITIPNDGEYGKSMGEDINYGAWWSYSFDRLGGLEPGGPHLSEMPVNRSTPGNVVLTSFADRRDRLAFADAYADPDSGVSTGRPGIVWPQCTGPVTYIGQEAVARDIANLKAAMEEVGVNDGFMTAIAPGSAARVANAFYESEDEFMAACGAALRTEYEAIIDAGLILQLDDPSIAENWDQVNPEPTVEDYQAFTMKRVEAINTAIAGLPRDRIRFHLCWGSWHGPHTTDIPMADIVDCMLAIDVGAYSFEAGNVRHEHEWKVWAEHDLAPGKAILPGVVSHATNVVEHPDLVADRIGRFAHQVGPENVIASTDCGLGGRVHRDIAWAKLGSLAAGAARASHQLGG